MKKSILLLAIVFSTVIGMSQELSPYFKIAESDKDISVLSAEVRDILVANSYDVIGEYSPANNDDLYVICYTSNELRALSLQIKDRGALASVLKVGFVKKEGKTIVSILNPEYMFLAYWGEQLNGQESQLKAISDKAVAAFSSYGEPIAFGGAVKAKDLPDYRYMMMMPYFTDPDELNEFASFTEGLATIRRNLKAEKGNSVLVYEQIFEENEIAVFGIGLQNPEDGEAQFLPIIGEDHIANMPYEIILQGKQATALAGKYRIALFWPSLTMGTFMKINSTPGNIKDVLEEVTK